MRISDQTLAIISTLADLVQQDDGNYSENLAKEISSLPDFENARATAGYYVTPDGDLQSDHWWLIMDDDSIFDGACATGPCRCSKKDPRYQHYHPYTGDKSIPLDALTFADRLKARNRTAQKKSFGEMVEDAAPASHYSGITRQELDAIERYADRLFQKVGIDVAFTKHFRQRVNDPRNEKPITVAELVRLFKQEYQKHGKAIARLGPDAEAVLADMKTDVNVPFFLNWDARSQMLDLVSKTVMRKKEFGTSDRVFPVESSGAAPSSDAPQQAASMPNDMTMGGREGVPQDDFDDEVRPEDMQLGWEDLIGEDDGNYGTGMCDAAALALHELTGLPLGLIGGDQHDEWDDEPAFMASHAVVLLGGDRWVDAFGIHRGIPDNLMVDPSTENIRIEPASEEDVRNAFTICDIDQRDIEKAKHHIQKQPWFSKLPVREVDHPEFMPGGDETHGYNGHDPTYDERSTQTNTGHPRP